MMKKIWVCILALLLCSSTVYGEGLINDIINDEITGFSRSWKTPVSDNFVTVGKGGDYATLTAAVAYIGSQADYTTVYSTGTADFVNGSAVVDMSGGADWTGIDPDGGHFFFLMSDGTWIPIGRIWHSRSPAFVALEDAYVGTTGTKSYSIIRRNAYTLKILPGTYTEAVIAIPYNLETIIGDGATSIWSGNFKVPAEGPGVRFENFAWALNSGQSGTAFCTILYDNVGTNHTNTSCKVHAHKMVLGKGSFSGDVFYDNGQASNRTIALLEVLDSEMHSEYDIFYSAARNYNIRGNDFYISGRSMGYPNAFNIGWSLYSYPVIQVDFIGNKVVIFHDGDTGDRVVGIELGAGLGVDREYAVRILNNYFYIRNAGLDNVNGIHLHGDLVNVTGYVYSSGNTFDLDSTGGSEQEIWSNITETDVIISAFDFRADGSKVRVSSDVAVISWDATYNLWEYNRRINRAVGAGETGYSASFYDEDSSSVGFSCSNLVTGTCFYYSPAISSVANFYKVSSDMSDGDVFIHDTLTSLGSGNFIELQANASPVYRLTKTGEAIYYPRTAAPGSPTEGMQVLADRVTWDPLSKGSGGSYFVWYNGSSWVAMDSQ